MAAGQIEAAQVSKHTEFDDKMQETSTPAAGVSTPRSVNSNVMYLYRTVSAKNNYQLH